MNNENNIPNNKPIYCQEEKRRDELENIKEVVVREALKIKMNHVSWSAGGLKLWNEN